MLSQAQEGKSSARNMQDRLLKPGKLEPDVLERLLKRNRIADPRVLVGPGVGLDVAVIDYGENLLVAKTDPITFATDEIGWYAVNVNANDIATAGARPRWFLATLLLPEHATSDELVEEIYDDLVAACRSMKIDLIGGHTEITCGLDRPILVGMMLGEVARDKLVRADGAQPGDVLLLTKRIAVEGTSLLGIEVGEQLAAATDDDFVRRCCAFLHEPGIGVLHEALLACEVGGVHAMHDPTEGGVATGISELARACGCGVRVEHSALPFYEETVRACEVFGLDPLGLIASGSLLIAAEPESGTAIRERLNAEGIECTAVGTVLHKGAPRLLVTEEGEQPLPIFPRDEIARLLSS